MNAPAGLLLNENAVVDLPGRFVSGLNEIREMLGENDEPGFVVADLTLGSWEDHFAARQIYRQLGLAWPLEADQQESTSRDINPEAAFNYAELVGQGIDMEARGEAGILDAFTLAETLLGAAAPSGMRILIAAPLGGNSWGLENEFFLYFLSRSLLPGKLQFVTVHQPEPTSITQLSIEWKGICRPAEASAPVSDLAFLVPGIISEELLSELGGSGNTARLRNGFFLPAPENRRSRGKISKTIFDRLSARLKGREQAAYAMYCGNNFFVDPGILAAGAWKNFARHSIGLATLYMERAAECARSPMEKAALLCQLQGMRIAGFQYAAAGSVQEPSASWPEWAQAFIFQSKGWGLVLSGNAAEAEKYLSKAIAMLHHLPPAELLFLKNIYALSKFRLGETEEALRLENEIETEHAQLAETDYQLLFVNSINLARVYRKKKDFASSEKYYRNAVSTTAGLCTDSDLLMGTISLANLFFEQERYAEALSHYFACALFWISTPVQEAVNKRTGLALQAFAPGKNSLSREENISLTLLNQLCRITGSDYGSMGLTAAMPVPVFSRTGHPEFNTHARQQLSGIFCDQMPVFVSAETIVAVPKGQQDLRLRHFIWNYIAEKTGWTGKVPATVFADAGPDKNFPLSPGDFLLSAAVFGAERILLAKESFVLDAGAREKILQHSYAALSPAIRTLALSEEEITVNFRRYRKPQVFSGNESRLLGKFAGAAGETKLPFSGIEDRESFNRLKTQYILIHKLHPELCSTDGTRSLLNAK